MRRLTSLSLMFLLLASVACDDNRGAGDGQGANNGVNNDAPNNDVNNDFPNNDGNNDVNNDGNNDGNNDVNNAACQDGERRCASGSEVEACQDGAFAIVETCGEQEACADGLCVGRSSCQPGEVLGCLDETSQRVCNEEGTAFVRRACADGLNCLEGQCTDMLCLPGTHQCLDRNTIQTCDDAGQGFVNERACPEGSLCLDGDCLSGCDLSEKFPSYIGCQYWSLDLDQYNDPFGDPSVVPHAVVLSNPSDQEALVTVSTEAQVVLPAEEIRVPPNGVAVYTFPRLDVDGTGISNNSFFLQSNWPVVAYQFNPLDNEGVASNDASLLLPAEALGREYIAMTWPTTPLPEQLGLPPQHGYVTIVATRPGRTRITVTPSADVAGGSNVPFMPEGVPQDFTLRQGQVLNLEADGSNLFRLQDLTGTIIIADQPVAVFGGHEEAVVGQGCCAEHLEQQLFPVASWGTRYLAVQSQDRGNAADVWRIVAAVDGTVVETVPPQPDAATFTLNRGEFRQIQTSESFEVVASGPVLVGQYLQSQEDVTSFIGDPAFILAAPIDSFRDDYAILIPEGYSQDWVTIMRPAGAEIRLDGQPVNDASFLPFGSGEFEYAWIGMDDGPHNLEGDQPFGLTIYGFSQAVSYGYSGGLNLRVDTDGQQ